MTELDEKLKDLRKLIQGSRFTAQILKNDSVNIGEKVEETTSNLNKLENDYKNAEKELNNTLAKVLDSRQKAVGLYDRALNLTATVTKTQEDLLKLQNQSAGGNLSALASEIDRLVKEMDDYTSIIEKKADYFKHCT